MNASNPVQAISYICKSNAYYEWIRCGKGVCEVCTVPVTVYDRLGQYAQGSIYCPDRRRWREWMRWHHSST